MPGFNKVILMGNLTRDPALKYLPNNTPVCECGIAVNERWKDRDGNQQERVVFVDFAVFGRRAEVFNQYMAKGREVLMDGRLKYDQWTSQEGQKRSKLSVVVEDFVFVGGKGDGQQQQSQPPAPAPGALDGPPSGGDIPF